MANKKRRCRFCKEYSIASEGKIINGGFYCSLDHAVSYGKKKAGPMLEKIVKSQHRARKAAIKPQTKRLNDLQTIVNQYIRLRDTDRDCISCNRPNDGSHQRHASHYKSRGANSFLRFNTLNIHASCAQCNNHKSGNIAEYRILLEGRYNLEFVEGLDYAPTIRKFSDEWILRAKAIFRKKIRLYEKRFRNK